MAVSVFSVCHNPSARASLLLSEARQAAKVSTSIDDDGQRHEIDNAAVDSLLQQSYTVLTGREDYVKRCSNLPDPKAETTKILGEMQSATETTDWAELYASGKTSYPLIPAMSSNLYEAGLVSFLCGMLRPKRVLEIGMFTGSMTLAFAAAKSVETVVTLEYEPYLEEWCRPYWKKAGDGVNEKIEVRVGDAKATIDKMALEGEAPFDFIFIDADKPSYLAYFRKIISYKLLSPTGVLMIDNTHFGGTAYAQYPTPLLVPAGIDQETVEKGNRFGSCMDEVNMEIRSHPEVEVMMLPVEDGLSLVKWKEV